MKVIVLSEQQQKQATHETTTLEIVGGSEEGAKRTIVFRSMHDETSIARRIQENTTITPEKATNMGNRGPEEAQMVRAQDCPKATGSQRTPGLSEKGKPHSKQV